MADVIIIGGGVTGCAIARELSGYNVGVVVLEQGNDVAVGATKANSGIVHAGFDAHPGTKKAYYNVRGAKLLPQKAKQLDFPYRQNGAFVLNFNDEGDEKLRELMRQGIQNGVSDLKILSGDEVRAMEPHVNKNVKNALYAPTSGIVSPYEMAIAYAENAATNGATFLFGQKVTKIKHSPSGFTVVTEKGDRYDADAVINCAGVYSDEINNMLCEKKYRITARKGEYELLDKTYGYITNATLFQLPTKMGKGVLVAPTAHGNIIVGPTAVDIDAKDDVDTTASGLSTAWKQALLSVDSLPGRGIITQFAGLRAHSDADDFVIGRTEVKGFYNCLGVESPGLTSSPAIAEDMAKWVAEDLHAQPKEKFIAERRAIPRFFTLTDSQRNSLIKQNPLFGNVVCRCEVVTEGEIVEAIRRVPGARDMDGIKRRTRAGMGRCQAGFCTPKIMEILARELGISQKEITKSGGKSYLIEQEEDK